MYKYWEVLIGMQHQASLLPLKVLLLNRLDAVYQPIIFFLSNESNDKHGCLTMLLDKFSWNKVCSLCSMTPSQNAAISQEPWHEFSSAEEQELGSGTQNWTLSILWTLALYQNMEWCRTWFLFQIIQLRLVFHQVVCGITHI